MADRAPSQGGEAARSPVVRLLAGFGRFWWDFLVGDTPELFVGTVVIVVVVALIAATHAHNALAVAALPALVAVLLWASVERARRRS